MRFASECMRCVPYEIFSSEHTPSFHEGRLTEECNELQEGIDRFDSVFTTIAVLSVESAQISRASILQFCPQK